MTHTAVQAKPSFNADVAAAVAQFLGPVVIELTALQINGKQAHWHVRGTSFVPVHELLDSIVDHAHEWTDLAAERVVALGLPIDARVGTVAAQTQSTALTAGFAPADQIIREVLAQIDVAREAVTRAVDALGDIDPASQDVSIEIQRGLDKDRWFLYAHIAEE
ncbi:MAG TPA: DNA starvation/stationary phase protection protein [Pseudoclavibacter sp.]|nr:DNA starvation/stationary phase protection protein [Pseudoclavibacter sp.]